MAGICFAFLSFVNFRRATYVITSLSLALSFSPVAIAGDANSCLGFYRPIKKTLESLAVAEASDDKYVFWPPPENAVLGTKTSQVANHIAGKAAQKNQSGRRKVYGPEIISREVYTPSNAPQSDKLYFAHKLLLGDLITSDLYAESVAKVLIESKIISPDQVKMFVSNFHGWVKLNPETSDRFLAKSAKEFASRLEEFVGDNVDFKKISEAQEKYGLSIEDLLQLKKNLKLMRENNDGNLRLSIMLPILEDAQLTIKNIEAAIARLGETKTAVAVVSETSNAITKPSGNQISWGLRSIKNLGRKIFNSGQYRFSRISLSNNEVLILYSEKVFNSSRGDFTKDSDFLKKIYADIKNGKRFKLSEVLKIVNQSPGYFFMAKNGRTKGGYTAIETNIRIGDFVSTLSKMSLEFDNLSAAEFMALQKALDGLKDILFKTSNVFSKELLALDTNLMDEVFGGLVHKQNEKWEEDLALKINQAKSQLSAFYSVHKYPEGLRYAYGPELEILNDTQVSPVIIEMFYKASRSASAVRPSEVIEKMADAKLTKRDVLYLLKNFDPYSYNGSWSLKGLYFTARIPAIQGRDLSEEINLTDLKSVFIGRLAMSFNSSAERLNLDDFSDIFDALQRSGVIETLLGKAALAKFYQSVIGSKPSQDESFHYDVLATEAYLETLKVYSFDHQIFLQENFGITVDPKKAHDPVFSQHLRSGGGTFKILNWIQGTRLRLNRGAK